MKRNMFLIILCILVIYCNFFILDTEVLAAHRSGCRGGSVYTRIRSNGSNSHTATTYCNACGNSINASTSSHSWSSSIVSYASCTTGEVRNRYCGECGYSYNSTSSNALGHSISGWIPQDKNTHYRYCTRCGSGGGTGSHYDNNVNGYCDACNYLMAIPAAANISGGVSVYPGVNATFRITLTKGTSPIYYQWYYNTRNSTSGGTPISGATGTSLTVTTNQSMNGRYYYCSMRNAAGTSYSPTALLTVWYPFTIGRHPADVNLKKNETGTFSVAIGTAGNPNSYTYQWYKAGSLNGAGSKIAGATGNSYSVKPTTNINQEYYYCEVSNIKYTFNSNRAKLVADITSPDIIMDNFDQNRIIKSTDTVKIPFTVTDTGQGYVENNNNFTSSDIVVKVGGVTITNVNKVLTYKGVSGNSFKYELTLTNITGDGYLSIEVPENSIKDNFNNGNLFENFPTNVKIDNTKPVVTLEKTERGINDKYANKEDEIVIKLAVTEVGGMDPSEFTKDDIVINVAGSSVEAKINKDLVYKEKVGDKYIYVLTISGLPGDGLLSAFIPANKITDYAKNSNEKFDIPILNGIGKQIIIDNTPPVIHDLITKLGSHTSDRNYPDSLAERHDNWSKENIYVEVKATDNEQIDYFMKSIGNDVDYNKISSEKDIISNSVNNNVYYRVVDMAGNTTDIFKEIKLDKITPNKPIMSLFEQRINGAPYIYDAIIPSTKSVYVIPNNATVIDTGSVQSGIEKDKQYTYYTITGYKDITKSQTLGSVLKFTWDEGFLLKESGYYEIVMTMEDIAGNKIISDTYKAFIEKKAENTIKINNINDIGSGINKVTIRIFKSDDAGNKTSEEAITPIVINNPYKEITKNVRLGDGKFFVEVTLEDNVGLKKVLEKTIINKL